MDYNILLSGPNPKHALSKDLLCPPVLEKSLEKTTNTTYLELENSLPNSIYLYKIRARTKTGMGNASVGEILTPPRGIVNNNYCVHKDQFFSNNLCTII